MRKRNIALVSHDGRKQEMMDWIKYNYRTFSKHNLFATGTTGKLIQEIEISERHDAPTKYIGDGYSVTTGDPYTIVSKPFRDNVTCLLSGPLGGDQEIGAMIAEGKIDCLIFFCDNLITQGHQQDVSALTRLAALYNVPFALNRSTADMVLTSPLFTDENYHRVIPECIDRYKNRKV